MKNGKTLVELAQAVQDAASRKVDTVVDTRNLSVTVNPESTDKAVSLNVLNKPSPMTEHALGQVLEHTGVPAKYAERMRKEAPDLLETNVNAWFQRKPTSRLIRQMQNGDLNTRAFLSNRYRRMDHDKQLAAVLPELLEQISSTNMEVVSTELTERRLYLKAVFPKFSGEVKKGDIVRWGFELQNSEIGEGRLTLIPFFDRLWCLNGATMQGIIDDLKLAKAHLGRKLEDGVLDYVSDEAIEADDKALSLVLRDTLRAYMDPSRWASVLATLREAAASTQVKDPIGAVAVVAKTLQLPKSEENEVLKNFLRDNDMTKWGMANAITRLANDDAVSYDRATELEALGGKIITLPASDWREITTAVALKEAA